MQTSRGSTRGRGGPSRGRHDPRTARSFVVRAVPQASAVAARQEKHITVTPPPLTLTSAAALYASSRIATKNDTSAPALAELEDILAQANLIADAGEYYRGWCNAASYAAACGLSAHLDAKNLQHLPVILAHTDKRAVLARLGLSSLIRYVPQQATPTRPFPLEAIGSQRVEIVPSVCAAAETASAAPATGAASGNDTDDTASAAKKIPLVFSD